MSEPGHGFLGAVLAGGRNTRYGAHKALETVGGVPIARRAADALVGAGCEPVVVIANDARAYARLRLPRRPDAHAGFGPLGGIHAALAWARDEGRSGAVVVAGDMPFADAALLRALADRAAAPGCDAAVPGSGGRRGVEPLCAAYAIACLSAVEEALAAGGGRIVGFYDRVRVDLLPREEVAAFGDERILFLNVNTPAQRLRAEALLAADADSGPDADPGRGDADTNSDADSGPDVDSGRRDATGADGDAVRGPRP